MSENASENTTETDLVVVAAAVHAYLANHGEQETMRTMQIPAPTELVRGSRIRQPYFPNAAYASARAFSGSWKNSYR
jgi:hypothetical protein